MKTILITFALLISSLSSFGQAYLYEKEKFGFNLSGLYTYNQESSILLFSPGVSLFSRVDLSLAWGKERNKNNDFSGQVMLFNSSVLVFKETPQKIPLSFNLGYQFQKNHFNNKTTLESNLLFAQLIKQFFRSEDFNYYAGLSHAYGSSKTFPGNKKEKMSVLNAFLTIHTKQSYVYLQPNYQYNFTPSKKYGQFIIGFGMIF